MIRDLLAQYLMPVLLVVGAALLVALGVQTMRVSDLQADVAKAEAAFAKYRVTATELANKALADREAERLALEKTKQESLRVALAQTQAAEADAATARTAGEQLRRALTAARAARCAASSDPGPGAASAPGPAAPDLLANVQLRLDEAADGVARYADALRTSGELCVAQYTSLTKE
jgi:hypothetical protein